MTPPIHSQPRSLQSTAALAIVVVTVTYGRRWHLLRQALQSARAEGALSAVVVDNGSDESIAALAAEEFGSFVEVLTLGKNTGSARGFRTGIERARERGAEFLLLLDDDNMLQAGCVEALSSAYVEWSATTSQDNLAMLAYRPDRQVDVVRGIPCSGMDADVDAFFNFNLRDVPFKLFRRTPIGKRWIAARPPRRFVTVAIAPYSGMLFHRSVLERHGLPDVDYLLYGDDLDFSYRLHRAGGDIVLVPDASVEDLEFSWNVKAKYSNTLDGLLLGEGDFRAFYSARNNAYFEHHRRCDGRRRLLRSVNRALYLSALRIRARQIGRQSRFALLVGAIRDGEAGRRGEHPDFRIG